MKPFTVAIDYLWLTYRCGGSAGIAFKVYMRTSFPFNLYLRHLNDAWIIGVYNFIVYILYKRAARYSATEWNKLNKYSLPVWFWHSSRSLDARTL